VEGGEKKKRGWGNHDGYGFLEKTASIAFDGAGLDLANSVTL